MADRVTARDEGSKFLPHPEGQYAAQCVDVVNLGERVEQYLDKPKKLVPKVAIVFQTGERNAETGELHQVSVEFTVSMGDKANLRKFLEQWRGKTYTDEQAEAGVPIDKLEGQLGLITVERKKAKGSGNLYATIKVICPLPKGMGAPTLPVYVRPDFWEERKKANATAAAVFRQESHPVGNGESNDFDDFPPPHDDDSDQSLPF